MKGNNIKFRQNSYKSKNDNKMWVVFITIVSFILSAALLFLSKTIFDNVNYIISIIVVLIIVIVGIVFDMIGIAVAAAEETPFHAMASKKCYGAKQSIILIRNADRVANFSNDVVGDICGVISGTASALIVTKVASMNTVTDSVLFGLLMSGAVASLTVGGKALGKSFALKNSNYIIYKVSVILEFFLGKINNVKK